MDGSAQEMVGELLGIFEGVGSGAAISELGGLAGMGSVLGGEASGGSVAGAVLKNAFGMVPLARLLFSIFGGGGEEETPAPLVKYAMPEAIDFEAADVGGGIGFADYDQMGAPRVDLKPTQAEGEGQTLGQGQAQITVNVQAMDARSFLDHSSEIAQAVREAMLNLSSINDVVNEL